MKNKKLTLIIFLFGISLVPNKKEISLEQSIFLAYHNGAMTSRPLLTDLDRQLESYWEQPQRLSVCWALLTSIR